MKFLLFFPILLIGIASVSAETTPAPAFSSYSATYEVSAGVMTAGKAGFKLDITDPYQYFYTSFIEPSGFARLFFDDEYTENSRGTIQAENILPQYYFYERTGGSKEQRTELTFDHDKQTVTNTATKSNWSSAISAGTLDRFAMQLQIMMDLWQERTALNYVIAEKKRIKDYRFEVLGFEQVETPAGTFGAIEIKQIRDKNKRKTHYWLAPALGYAMVKITHKNGSSPTITSLLTKIKNQPLPKVDDATAKALVKKIKESSYLMEDQ